MKSIKNNFSISSNIQNLNESLIVERGDASHFGVIRDCLERHLPDFIIHLAALPLAKLPNLNVEEAREGRRR